MNELKLPSIEPVGPVVSPAGAIARAGAQFGQAMEEVGKATLVPELAQMATQMQEAHLQSTRGLVDTLDLIKRTPYVDPERARDLFGGKLPEGVNATEPVAGPDGKVTQQLRKIIPMHELVPALFDQQSAVSVENAAANVKEPGWQKQFRQAAAKDVEAARAEALNWQRAQSLADAEIRSVAQFQQAVSRGWWSTAESILDNAHMTMGVETRGKLREMYPSIRTESELKDRFNSANTVADVDKFVADLSSKPKEGEKAAFYTQPTDKQQDEWMRAAGHKRKLIVEQEYAALLEKASAPLRALEQMSPAQRRYSATRGNLYATIDPRLKWEDQEKFRKVIEDYASGKDIPFDSGLWAELVRDGDAKLKSLTEQQVKSLEFRFPPAKHEELMDRWSKLQKGESVGSDLDARTSSFIDAALENWKLDKKGAVSAEQHNAYWGDVAQEVIKLRQAKGKDYFVTQNDVSRITTRLLGGAPKSNIGDTGVRDIDVGEKMAATDALAALGQPSPSADKVADFARKARSQKDAIESAWDTWAPENPSITPAQRTYIYGMAQDPRTRRKYEDLYRSSFAKKLKPVPGPLSDEQLYGMIIEEKFANTESRAKYPEIRDRLERDVKWNLLDKQNSKDWFITGREGLPPDPTWSPATSGRQPGESTEAARERLRKEREARIAAEDEANKKARAAAEAAAAAARAARAAERAAEDAKLQREWDERQRRIQAKAGRDWERP